MRPGGPYRAAGGPFRVIEQFWAVILAPYNRLMGGQMKKTIKYYLNPVKLSTFLANFYWIEDKTVRRKEEQRRRDGLGRRTLPLQPASSEVMRRVFPHFSEKSTASPSRNKSGKTIVAGTSFNVECANFFSPKSSQIYSSVCATFH